MDAGRSILNFTGGLTDRLLARIPDFMLRENPLARDAYVERLRFYAEWDDRTPFFPRPDIPPDAEQVESRPHGQGERILLRYPSRFHGHNRALRDDLARERNNQWGYLHLWRHDGTASRPLVLCVHGFAMAGPTRGQRMFKIGKLFDLGLDVALYHLPHHWRRSDDPPHNPFLRPQDVPVTIEEWVRNVHDLHSAVLLLRAMGYASTGLIGASLGGLTGALYATGLAPLEFVFLVVPAVDLTSFLLPRASRMAFRPDDEVLDLTHRALRRITPLHYDPVFDVARMAVVAHQGDRICPVEHTRELVARWNIQSYTEVVGGHWVYLDHAIRGRTWYGWLQRMGFLPPRSRCSNRDSSRYGAPPSCS